MIAYHMIGPYGDGPFGAGFRRIPVPGTGRSILVHDLRNGAKRVRAVIDEQTGRVAELQLFEDGNDAPMIRVYLDGDGKARVPRDLDADGVADRWEYYADPSLIESGATEKVGFSLGNDDIVDAWAFHDEDGQVSRVEVATQRDGVVDRWEYYAEGVLARVETDTDRDGRVDTWSTYRDGILVTTDPDADGDGHPDPPHTGVR